MNYFTTTSAASRRAVDCVIVGIYDSGRLSSGASDIDGASKGSLKRLLKNGDISPRLGRCVVLTDVVGVKATRVAVVGLGKYSAFDVAKFRQALGAALQAVSGTKSREVLNTLTLEDVSGAGSYYLARHTAQTVGEALYRFTAMKSGKKEPLMPLRKVGLAIAKQGDAAKSKRGAEHGAAIVAGMSLAKDLGNLPANVCTPSHIARTAQKLAREHKNLTTKVLNEAEMKRLGMHSLLSVTAGTKEPAKLIVMQYKGKTVVEARPRYGRNEIRHVRCGRRDWDHGSSGQTEVTHQCECRRSGRREPAEWACDETGRYRQEHVRPDH
jgi:leucyl aminopeptidase